MGDPIKQDVCKLKNNQGVKLDCKMFDHWSTLDSKCSCGYWLMVAPPVFRPDHQQGNPVMICEDHGVCAYRFKDLVVGTQPTKGE